MSHLILMAMILYLSHKIGAAIPEWFFWSIDNGMFTNLIWNSISLFTSSIFFYFKFLS